MKILVIRFSSIGDIVLTTPVIRCLKKQTGAEIHYLSKEIYRDLLESNPYIDHVLTLGKDWRALKRQLRQHKYRYIIDLHHNLRSWKVQWILGKRASTLDKQNFRKWKMVRFPGSKAQVDHIVIRYLETLRSLGVRYDGEGLDFFPDPSIHLPESPDSFICFAIGGTHNTKKLPEEKIRDLCTALAPKPIVLLGGKEDMEVASIVETGLDHVRSVCGKVSIGGSAGWIRKCQLLITHDTGMMHIGAALRKPVISIWGNTVPAFGMYPWYPANAHIPSYQAEVTMLQCRPCSKIGFEACPRGHFRCMRDQNISQIVREVNRILSSLESPSSVPH